MAAQVQLRRRSLPRLLRNRVEQPHHAVRDAEENAIDVPIDLRSNLIESLSEPIHERKADRPPPLDLFDVRPYLLADGRWHPSEPFADGFVAGCRHIEPTGKPRPFLADHLLPPNVSKKIRRGQPLSLRTADRCSEEHMTEVSVDMTWRCAASKSQGPAARTRLQDSGSPTARRRFASTRPGPLTLGLLHQPRDDQFAEAVDHHLLDHLFQCAALLGVGVDESDAHPGLVVVGDLGRTG